VRALGASGVLDATDEIANVHMIFGNEFMVKAVSRPFSTDGADSETLVRDEIARLEKALQQYRLATAALVQALNLNLGGGKDIYIGDYFTPREFQLFSSASQRQVEALIEIAKRERILPGRADENNKAALERLRQAYAEQYLQSLALASAAAHSTPDNPATPNVDEGRKTFLDNGGWQIIDNLRRIAETAQTIEAGLNPLGYDEFFVPLRSFEDLLQLTCGGTRTCSADGGLLNTAAQAGADLKDWNRAFDASYTELKQELGSLNDDFNNQLVELCGPATGKLANGLATFEPCGPRDTNTNGAYDNGDGFGGLLGQNYWDLLAASDSVALAHHRVAEIPQKIKIEQDRTSSVINLITQAGATIEAKQLAIGLANSEKTLDTTVLSNGVNWYAGAEASFTVGSKFTAEANANPVGCIIGGCAVKAEESIEAKFALTAGVRYDGSYIATSETVKDPSAVTIAGFESNITAAETLRDSQIEGANSAAVIKQLLLDEVTALDDYRIAVSQFSRVVSEHNTLVARYQELLTQRQSNFDALANDSPLTKPYTRLFRDAAALRSITTLDQATQAAYLTAKAYEYLTMSPVPYLNELYRVRNADNLRDFLDKLAGAYAALPREQFSKRTYRLSLAEDILGLTDANLNPKGALTPAQVEAERASQFRAFLEQNRYRAGGQDKIAYVFGTTLDNPKFLRGVFNNRIARVGSGDPGCASGCRGLWMNLVTDQSAADFKGDLPQIKLTHGGSATYRDGNLHEVTYRPGPALMIGRSLPPGFASGDTRAALMTSHVNLGLSEQPNPNYLEDRFYDLSIATSQWVLEIDLTSPSENTKLDLSKIRDIEIRMDTTYVTPASNAKLVQMDGQRLDALDAGTPVPADVAAFLASYHPERPAPAAAPSAAPAALATAAASSGYAYRGQFFVKAPVNLGMAEIGFDLAIAGDGAVGGRLCKGCTPLYSEAPAISGRYDAATRAITFATASFGGSINGRAITRKLSFSGKLSPAGDKLEGTYSETIDGYTPQPIATQGEFLVTRNPVPVAIAPDSPAVLVNPGSIYVVSGGASASYTLVLGSKPAGDVSVTIAPDSALQASAQTLTFTPANWDLPQTVSVSAPRPAGVPEGLRQATIHHSVASAAGSPYNGLAVADLSVQISDRANTPDGGQTHVYLPLVIR
jgi:hypothetical protein